MWPTRVYQLVIVDITYASTRQKAYGLAAFPLTKFIVAEHSLFIMLKCQMLKPMPILSDMIKNTISTI
jgi:hypothetical protein